MANKKYDEASNEIEYLVLKNFITVLKHNGMYPLFRCVVGTNTKNVVSVMYSKMRSFERYYHHISDDNIFREAGNMNKFVELMKTTQHGGLRRGETDPAKIQRHIADCVNMLLHVFIERNVRDMRRLEQLGGQIFEMTCRGIFGGEFQDMLPEPPQKMKELNEMMLNGQRPTKEMIEELKRAIAEEMHNRHMQPNDPHDIQPHQEGIMVNEEDWDFLDDFINEGVEYQDERDDEEDDGWFDDEVADAPLDWDEWND